MSEARAERSALQLIKPYQPSVADQQHEAVMRAVLARFEASSSPVLRRRLWNEYRRLHAQRSPEMVAHMEHEKGLRR